jgi:hypothetical protein
MAHYQLKNYKKYIIMLTQIELSSELISPRVFNTRNRLNANKKWINYGEDNILPQGIIYLLENSTTIAAIVNKIAQDVSGFGITIVGDQTNKYNSQLPLFKEWLAGLSYDRGISGLLYKLAYDLAAFGGFTTLVQFTPGTTLVRDIIYQDFSQVRRGFKYTDDLYNQILYINPHWEDSFTGITNSNFLNNTIEYPLLTKEMLENGSDETAIDYYFRSTAGREWYPLPHWWSAYRPILSEIYANQYIQSQFQNGFFPGGILEIPATLSEEQERELKMQLTEGLKGVANAGKALVLKKIGESAVNYIPLVQNTLNVEGITALLLENKQQIITAAGMSSKTLIGLEGGASLGGDGGTIETAAEEFHYKIVLPIRMEIINRLQRLFKAAGYEATIDVRDDYHESLKPIENKPTL